MDPATWLLMIRAALGLVVTIWSSARKLFGKEAIPSLEELLQKNEAFQAEIDADLAGAPPLPGAGPDPMGELGG